MHFKPNPGDFLYRSKGPVVDHMGVYLGNERVVHNSPHCGVQIISMNEFANGHSVSVKRNSNCDANKLNQRLNSFLSKSKEYQVLFQNCEQLAHYLVFGRAKSPQVQAALLGFVFTGTVAKTAGSPNWFFYSVIGGITACVVENQLRSYDN